MPRAEQPACPVSGDRRRPAGFLLRPRKWGLLGCALLAVVPAMTRAQGSGIIEGQAFTANEPDSVAAGAEVTLIYRDAAGTVRHLASTAGADGAFRFSGLSCDSSIAYVLKIDHRGVGFLGSPLHFHPPESKLEFNVLVSPSPQSAAADAPSAENLPPGHPAVTTAQPPTGRAVPERPGLMLVLTGGIAAIFALPLVLLRRRDRQTGPGGGRVG